MGLGQGTGKGVDWAGAAMGSEGSEDGVHVEKIVVRHAPLAALMAGDMGGVAQALDRVEGVDLLALILGDLLELTFVARAGHIVDGVGAQVNQVHG